MADKPIFKKVLQIGLVIKNLERSMKNYWGEYGIGPWAVYTFDPSSVADMTIRNKYVDYAMRLAFTTIGDMGWDLIQPLDEKSIYAEFLRDHGEGLHHVSFDVGDYNQAISFFQGKGIGTLQGGTWRDFTYTYLGTQDTLATIAEIYSQSPEGLDLPAPEGTYP